MKLPDWDEVKNKIRNFKTKYPNASTLIDVGIDVASEFLPPPLIKLVQFVWETTSGTEEEKYNATMKCLNNLLLLEKQHYEQLSELITMTGDDIRKQNMLLTRITTLLLFQSATEHQEIMSELQSIKNNIAERKSADQSSLEERLRLVLATLRNRALENYIPLRAEVYPSKEPRWMSDIFQEWLSSDKHILTLLGDAGAGKTTFLIELSAKLGSDKITENMFLPVYIDLRKHATRNSLIDMIAEELRTDRTDVEVINQIIDSVSNGRLLVLLDAFDEYETGGLEYLTTRHLEDFEILMKSKAKTIVVLRSTFVGDVDKLGIKIGEGDFSLAPKKDAIICELLPVTIEEATHYLKKYQPEFVAPPRDHWFWHQATHPLYLDMIGKMLEHDKQAINFQSAISRPQLYEKYFKYMLEWDSQREGGKTMSSDLREELYTQFAVELLNQPRLSLPLADITTFIQKLYRNNKTFRNKVIKPNKDLNAIVTDFRKNSGLLKVEGGSLLFSHKSLLEYTVARHIMGFIRNNDTSFDWIWFTRNERRFLAEMITGKEHITTLLRWLMLEDKGPACNFSAFILGRLGNGNIGKRLWDRFNETGFFLLKLNCANSLAYLGRKKVLLFIEGIILAYIVDSPALVNEKFLKLYNRRIKKGLPRSSDLKGIEQNYNSRKVMILHFCECIEAYSLHCGKKGKPLLEILTNAEDQDVVKEAKSALQRIDKDIGVY